MIQHPQIFLILTVLHIAVAFDSGNPIENSGLSATRKCPSNALYFQAQPVSAATDIVSLYESAADSVDICVSFCYTVADCKSIIFTVGFDEYPGRCRLTSTELGCDSEFPQINSFPANVSSIRYLVVQCIECKADLNQNGSYPPTSFPSLAALNRSVALAPAEETTEDPFTTPVEPTGGAEWLKFSKKPVGPNGYLSCNAPLNFSFLPASEFVSLNTILEISTTSVNSCVATCYSVPECTSALYHVTEVGGVTYRRCRLSDNDLNCNADNPQVSDFPDVFGIEYLLVYCIECRDGSVVKLPTNTTNPQSGYADSSKVTSITPTVVKPPCAGRVFFASSPLSLTKKAGGKLILNTKSVDPQNCAAECQRHPDCHVAHYNSSTCQLFNAPTVCDPTKGLNRTANLPTKGSYQLYCFECDRDTMIGHTVA